MVGPLQQLGREHVGRELHRRRLVAEGGVGVTLAEDGQRGAREIGGRAGAAERRREPHPGEGHADGSAPAPPTLADEPHPQASEHGGSTPRA